MFNFTEKAKLFNCFLFVNILVTCCCCKKGITQKINTVDSAIYLADPAIFNYQHIFYLYGTVGSNANNGFLVYTSPDMKRWKKDTSFNNGFALKKGDVYGSKNFWAPQVLTISNKIYMAYVADENIAIATAEKPSGPFTQVNKVSLEAPVKQIDPFIFIDDDGKKYLYHVRLTNGNKIFVAEMEGDLSAIKPATLKECITATTPWENTANTSWPVTEGPTVLKHKNIYYLIYTANDFRNPDYAVGYATSNSPYGPWEKYAGNPIISKSNIGINGTGHGDFVMDEHNNLVYVFHTHFSDKIVAPRRTALIKANFTEVLGGVDKLEIDPKSFRFAVTGN